VVRLDEHLDALPDPALLLELDGTIRASNGAARALLGLGDAIASDRTQWTNDPPSETMAGRTLRRRWTALWQLAVRAHEARARRARRRVTGTTADGSLVAVDASAAVVTDDAGRELVLVIASEAAARLERQKDGLVATLAHELCDPLVPILGAVHVMGRFPVPDVKVRQAREIVERQARRLVQMLDDLLDLCRIARGTMTLAREPVDLVTVVREALENAGPRVRARRHELAVEVPSKPLVVAGDAPRLTQVMAELVTAVAESAVPGGRITVDVDAEGDDAVVRVKDTGLDIAPGALPRMFDLSAEAASGTDWRCGRLALTHMRSLVELHGGTVSVSSKGVGSGSEFVVRLPAPWAGDGA
jgi:signal transduction histidine kinase